MPNPPANLKSFDSLLQVIADLRGPEGCPWDKEQSHKSLTRYTIEECYEFVDAVNNEDFTEMKDELGDVLLQVVLHAQIAKESDRFNIDDIIEGVNQKMVRRHPHVFSNTKVTGTDEVWKNWEEIKKIEKKNQPKKEGFDIPKHLNGLIKSLKMGEKAKKRGFDWDLPADVLLKVKEETQEIKLAIDSQIEEDIFHEVGDLLFSVCQLARHLKIDPEQALQVANTRFEHRFFKMEKSLKAKQQEIKDLSPQEIELAWKKNKAT